MVKGAEVTEGREEKKVVSERRYRAARMEK